MSTSGQDSPFVDETVQDDLPTASDLQLSDEDEDEQDQSETSTSHYRRLQRAEDAWAKLREGVLTTTFENEGSLFGMTCHFCGSEAGICRCLDCGSTISFCEACAVAKHGKYNIFHRVEVLRVSMATWIGYYLLLL